jgi:phage baseplate assembly protein W
MAEKAISLPFVIDAYGKIGQTQDQSKIWADRVRSVIGTTLRERVMRPTLGTVIPYAMFENEDNAQAEIEIEVSRAFSEQLPLLRLSTVTTTADQYTNTLTIEIVYALPNNEVVSTVVGLVLIQGAKPIYQELL